MIRALIILTFVGSTLPAAAAGKLRLMIRPLMSDTCFHCHGPDKNARKAELRLDIREEALKPAKSGELPIVPGDPEKSEIIKRLFTDDKDDLMPPEEAHKTFTPEQKETFKRWVAEGAEYEPHWAYTPLVRPVVPSRKNAETRRRGDKEKDSSPHLPISASPRLLRDPNRCLYRGKACREKHHAIRPG